MKIGHQNNPFCDVCHTPAYLDDIIILRADRCGEWVAQQEDKIYLHFVCICGWFSELREQEIDIKTNSLNRKRKQAGV
jgi:hypothetical protein